MEQQIDVLFTDKDFESLVGFLLAKGAKLIPDTRYPAQDYRELDSLPKVIKARAETKFFFVVHPSFAKCHLEMRQFKDHAEFYIMQRNGGPTIDLYCPGLITKGDVQIIGQGFVGCYPTFWNTFSKQNEKVPQELEEFYRETVTFVRQMCMRREVQHRRLYIGPHAARLIETGVKVIY